MSTLLRTAGDHGALFGITGVIPTGATWDEDIYFAEDGLATVISGYTEWRITLRSDPTQTSALVTLSTLTGELTIANDGNGVASILRIGLARDTLTAKTGDYIIDIASLDSSNAVKLWGHGSVTLQPNPPTF